MRIIAQMGRQRIAVRTQECHPLPQILQHPSTLRMTASSVSTCRLGSSRTLLPLQERQVRGKVRVLRGTPLKLPEPYVTL